ncbi:MAG: hypothetical protein ACW967_07080 [Candidatus Hodarchaeales archaeon]|jgi:hypothetical protein
MGMEPKPLLALFSTVFQQLNLPGFNYDVIRNSFMKLEEKIGEIDITWNFSKIKEPYRTESYNYLLEDIIGKIVQFIGLYIKKSQPTEPSKDILGLIGNVITDFTTRALVGTNEDLLSQYCRLWETYNNLLVERIWYKIGERKRRPKYYQVESVKEFLLSNLDFRPLYNLINHIDTNLRNSITHLNYYINTEENRLYFFYKGEEKMEMGKKMLTTLENNVKVLLAGNFMLILLIGEKLGQEMSNELVGELKKKFNL